MIKYCIFLKGVNVGGHNIIKMDLLKDLLIKSGYINIKTYINSGNIFLISNEDKISLKNKVQKIIRENFKLDIEMIIKTKQEIEEIINNNPYNNISESDNSKRIVVLLSNIINNNKLVIFQEDKRITENYYLIKDLLYIYYTNGAGSSKFTNSFIEKKLNIISTARNWNTILKMNEIML